MVPCVCVLVRSAWWKKHRRHTSTDRHRDDSKNGRVRNTCARGQRQGRRRGRCLDQITSDTVQTLAQAPTHSPGWCWKPPSFDLGDVCARVCGQKITSHKTQSYHQCLEKHLYFCDGNLTLFAVDCWSSCVPESLTLICTTRAPRHRSSELIHNYGRLF